MSADYSVRIEILNHNLFAQFLLSFIADPVYPFSVAVKEDSTCTLLTPSLLEP